MKKFMIFLIAAFLGFLLAGPAMAGGCGDRSKGGECFNPGQGDTGSIGTSTTWEWGEGYFDDLTVSGAMTMPAKVHRIGIPLASVFVDGTGPITSATAPNLTTKDNVGAIVYDDSGETAEIQFPWMPDTSFTAMSVKLIVSSDDASGAATAVDWSIFVHGNDDAFPSATVQTGVSATSGSLNVDEELLTLTLDATGISAVTAGTTPVTVAVWNNSSNDDDLEIKKIWIEETRTK